MYTLYIIYTLIGLFCIPNKNLTVEKSQHIKVHYREVYCKHYSESGEV